MKILYTATATSSAGRAGHVRSDDGVLDLDLAIPVEMGGKGGAATNPEQLFAAGYAACFHSALKLAAQQQGIPASNSALTARVGIGKLDEGGYGLAVELRASMPDIERDKAQAILEEAHRLCPYSNATRGNVDVKLVVE